MPKKIETNKIGVCTEPPKIRKRSERIVKRKVRLESSQDGGPNTKITKKAVPKASKNAIKEASNDKKQSVATEVAISERPREPPKDTSNEPVQVRKKNKKKVITYTIDCTLIEMDVTNFRKDLWHRAKNGKINSIQNIRVKQQGKTIYITTRCYVPKKCIRSNVHFLMEAHLKQKKIDRPVHLVGNKNVYQMVYK